MKSDYKDKFKLVKLCTEQCRPLFRTQCRPTMEVACDVIHGISMTLSAAGSVRNDVICVTGLLSSVTSVGAAAAAVVRRPRVTGEFPVQTGSPLADR